MMMAAAKELAAQSPTVHDSNAPLLPPVADSRKVAMRVADSVARQAITEGVSAIDDPSSIADAIRAYVWDPIYRQYERIYLHAGRSRENPDFAI
jgi:malate dehydrogenase (oxaloacetate-decarboxylating)